MSDNNKVTITESEMKAYHLMGGGTLTNQDDGKIKKAADEIIQLAEKIKSERRKAAM